MLDPPSSSGRCESSTAGGSSSQTDYTFIMIFARVERCDGSYKARSESTCRFLDRVSGSFWDRVRALIEDWLAGYPEADRAELVSRLQGDDVSFRAAYWELYLSALVKAHGGAVTCHPSMPDSTNRPDFLIEALGEPFYLEAKVLETGSERGVRDRWRDEVWQGLNQRVTSEEFFVSLDIETFGHSAPPISKFAKDVAAWLRSLDPAVVTDPGSDEQFDLNWTDDATGWQISLSPIRKTRPSPHDRLVGIGGGESGFFGDREAVRNAIAKKYRRYGATFNRPFVVALAIHRIGVDSWDVNQALFGNEVLVVPGGDAAKAYPNRAPNGLWLGRRARGTRLSAVLTAEGVTPWGAAESQLVLWRNPWADKPLSFVFSNAARVELVGDRLERIEADRSSRECFNLDDEWPGPDPAFDEP